jgi:hypothetical protein
MIAKLFLNMTHKQLRQRFINYLSQNLFLANFSNDEDNILLSYINKFGKIEKWKY